MSAQTMPGHEPSQGVSPEAAELIETYFARVQGAMLVTAAGEASEAVDELRGHVLEELAHTDGSPASLARILAEFGPPEALAARYGETARPAEAPTARGADESPLAGRVLGVPYELRVPTAERIASRLWNPLDPHVFVPRVFGVGWDINFAALAIRLGLLRPDDEDEPFGAVPRTWLRAALAVPAAITLAVAAVLALRYGQWPALAPSQWGFSGEPHQWWPKGAVALFLLALSGIPTLGALSVLARARSAVRTAAASAAAALLATIALGQTAQTAWTLSGGAGLWPTWIGLTVAVALPFAMLTVLSRIGRAREQRRDLEDGRDEERV